MVRDLGHMFFAVPMDDESQPMTAFPWEGRGDQFAGLAQGYLSSPVMAHNTTFQQQDIQAFDENTHKTQYFL